MTKTHFLSPLEIEELEENIYKNRNEKALKIFFYRICGTGMASSATLLKEKGHHVEGADVEYYPPMSNYLKESRIPCFSLNEVKDDYLKTFDLIIVGNVIAKNSDHAKRLEELNIPLTSFPAAIGAMVLKSQNVVGIAGTHGKTTTTYFLLQLFSHLGVNPGYLVGGVLPDAHSSSLGDGKYFFIESDEYDSSYFHKEAKFQFYYLDHLILTSLEFDHADIYSSVESIEEEFRKLLNKQLIKSGIFSVDYPSIQKLTSEQSKKNHSINSYLWYGEKCKRGEEEKKKANGPFNIKFSKEKLTTFFEIIYESKTIGFETNVKGPQNILNLTAAILFALKEGFEAESIKSSILNLKMVMRRQEVIGFYKGARIIDDFAHHPTAMRLTLKGIRESYPNSPLIVVFAPMSATARSSIFQQEFTEELFAADEVILVEPNKPTSIQNRKSIDCEEMSRSLSSHQISTTKVSTLQELIHQIDQNIEKCRSDEKFSSKTEVPTVLILSNGNILGLLESSFINEIKR